MIVLFLQQQQRFEGYGRRVDFQFFQAMRSVFCVALDQCKALYQRQKLRSVRDGILRKELFFARHYSEAFYKCFLLIGSSMPINVVVQAG